MKITKREQEVLENISLGYTTKEIAHMLYLSSHTIISHKKKLLEKLDAVNGPELVRKGFVLGVLSVDEQAVSSL